MRLLIWGIICLMLLSPASAKIFDEDTTFTEGNINYIFKEGIEFDSFDITSGGIRINGDEKFGLTIQGGEVTLIFHEFNDVVKKIEFQSTVPQVIDFNIVSDGVKQYLFDGNKYHLNNYNIGTSPVNFTFVAFEDDVVVAKSSIEMNDVQKLDWWKQKLVEFEISSEIDENGIIDNKTFSITYLWFTIIMIILIIGVILWWNY